jgi:Zn-finger nucleic acid-binding protein
MRAYERNGVTVDQCTECRGIFLDRGELEKLVDAEATHFAPPQKREPEYREYRENYGGHGYHGKRRKKSFLEELFD